MRIESWSAEEVRRHPAELVALLQETVDAGASVGFLPPLGAAEARAYWSQVANELAAGSRVLLVAIEESVIGAVQLGLAGMPNGRHRAEVMKLMVLPSARGRGVGSALMERLEEAARAAGRSLLVLDTRESYDAERLYRRLGWIEAGRVPRYAKSAGGELEGTVFFYKELSRQSG